MKSEGCRRAHISIGLAVLLVLTSGCGGNPAATARAFILSGDQYVARGNVRAASLEYRNALEHQPDAADTHYKLALAYQQLGEHDKALAAFARVTELDGRNTDAHLRVSSAMLARRRFDEAERLAQRVLTLEPRNVRALITSASALDGLKRQSAASKRLDEALAIDPRSSLAHLTRGLWHVRDGRIARGREALANAVEYDPTSADAWTALGTLHWRSGQHREAEQALTRALDVSVEKLNGHRMLASFFVAIGRAPDAESHLRAAAERGPRDRLVLADYYLRTRQQPKAEPILAALLTDKTVQAEARLRRAVLAQSAGRETDAQAELDAAMGDASVEARARVVKSGWLVDKGDLHGALQNAERAAALQPRWPDAHYVVGMIRFARAEWEDAERAFKRARDFAATPAVVDVQLARVALAKGDAMSALRRAEQAANSAPTAFTHSLVARTARLAGDLGRARTVVTNARRTWKDSADLETELGYVELAARRPGDARRAFERVLRLTPKSTATQYGLVTAYIADGRVAVARTAMAEWRTAAPDDVPLGVLSARLDMAEGHLGAAEGTLRRLVQRRSHSAEAAEALAELHLITGKQAEAIEQYERVVTLRVRSTNAWTKLGILKWEIGDTAGARAAYEHAVDIDRNAGVAANNLAWLLAADGRVDDAVEWARRAEAALPGVAEALDTLGWMYHLSGRSDKAIPLLASARDKTPRNPTYHHHLGAAYLRAGRTAEARSALHQALQISNAFEGAEDARQALAVIR